MWERPNAQGYMAYAYVFCEPHVSVIKGTVSGVTCTEPRNGKHRLVNIDKLVDLFSFLQ
jgi:hypothetical protein